MRNWMIAGLALGVGVAFIRTLRAPAAPATEAELSAKMRTAFGAEVAKLIAEAKRQGAAFVDVNAAALHRRVGGYPGPHHHMTACCAAMREALGPDDFATAQPRSGSGPSLTLRYHLA